MQASSDREPLWEAADALDHRLWRLLEETPDEAKARARGRFELEVHDFGRLWLWGRGILAQRVARVLDAAGLCVVGRVSDDRALMRDLKNWRWQSYGRHRSPLVPDFTAIATGRHQVHMPPQKSWEDFLCPVSIAYSRVAWRFDELAPSELFVPCPGQLLHERASLLQSWRLLSDAASRDLYLQRLQAALGQEHDARKATSAAPHLVDAQFFPTPLPENSPGDLSQRHIARSTDCVYDFCDPRDAWCEQTLRTLEPSGWKRIAFHPSYDDGPCHQRAWLWPMSWVDAGQGAANQQSVAAYLAQLETYAYDYALELGVHEQGGLTDVNAKAWDLLFATEPGSFGLLRIQGFCWEALCPRTVQILSELLQHRPNLELRWETPHAIEVMASWAKVPQLHRRLWKLEPTEHPNLDAVILRRTGR